jgi:hypothetical protein
MNPQGGTEMSNHTPEPWRFEHGAIYGAESMHISGYEYPAPDGGRYSSKSYTDKVCDIIGGYDNETRNTNGARAVACVNACAGINPEAVPEFVHLARLVASLNENHLEIGAGRMLEMVTVARNALAKAEVK